MKILTTIVSLWLLLAAPVLADSGWATKYDQDGILVQQQQTGSPHETTRGVVELEATLDALAAVLGDVSACPRWIHGCKQSQAVKTITPARRIVYTVLDAPFPLEDRDMYVESVVRYRRSANTLVVNLTGRETYAPEQAGRTRILGLRGAWVFQQTESGKVQVRYQIQADPQAPFDGPSNDHMAESAFKTLQGLRKLVQEPQYRDKQFTEEEIREIAVK